MEEQNLPEKNPVEERIINLNKRTKEAEEKAELEARGKEEALAKASQLEKENSFLNSFTDVSSKFPGATEFKEKIREKVMNGYSAEDATISVLHSEGKLNTTTPAPKIENVTGGSAPNQITNQATKSVKEMTSSERWAVLAEAEARGDIGVR